MVEITPVLPLHAIVPDDAVTVPEPVPDFTIVRVRVLEVVELNVAVTSFEDVIDT
ncbi:hypothetical protein ASN18_3338 [Candidatus Magnetominusculus xianensis]|uniref:Uncharacterized protein n=1 Tax=Candidatus Magnetominusculus xianensis TaxID=1748249 RepID=A0ABR5SAZ9_9BACT|nr:hypothetical protein ASN18_3338 [Candidatus Magnetominusculus xianensis]